jgi:hypothetical protein
VYLLAKELFSSVGGATLAGALTAVSPYLAGHALGHLNLMWVFGLPFLAYLVTRSVRGRLRTRWLVALVALTVAFTIGASTELFVTQAVFGCVGLAVAVVTATAELRRRLIHTVPWLALGGVVGLLLASPVILAALRTGLPDTVANPAWAYPTDLTNLVAPTPVTLLGDGFFAGLRSTWLANDAENTGYLPITLLLLAGATVVLCRWRLSAGLALFAGIALLFSFGPVLTVAGWQSVPLPWTWAA